MGGEVLPLEQETYIDSNNRILPSVCVSLCVGGSLLFIPMLSHTLNRPCVCVCVCVSVSACVRARACMFVDCTCNPVLSHTQHNLAHLAE